MTTKRALIFGSVMVDTIAVMADRDIERITMHNEASTFLLLEQGRKIDAEGISSHIGGGAANVGISMQRQGCDVEMLAVVGNDPQAARVKTWLEEQHIGTRHFAVDQDAETGCSVLISAHDHNAAVFTHRGANTGLCLAHFSHIDFSSFDIVYASSLSGQSSAQFGEILKRGKSGGAFVATNPGVLQLGNKPNQLLSNAKHIDLLTLNRTELMVLLPSLELAGKASTSITAEHAPVVTPSLVNDGLFYGGKTYSIVDIMMAVCEAGVAAFVLTDGKDGSYYCDGTSFLYTPSVHVEPKGTAGAGDAFASTLALHLANGIAPEMAMAMATLNASSVIGAIDAQTGLLGADQLHQEFEQKSASMDGGKWIIKTAGHKKGPHNGGP